MIGSVFTKRSPVQVPINGRIQCFVHDVFGDKKPRIYSETEIQWVINKLRQIFGDEQFAIHASYYVVFRKDNKFSKQIFSQEMRISQESGARFYIAHFSEKDSFLELQKMQQGLTDSQKQILTLELDASRLVESQKFLGEFFKIRQILNLKLCLDTAHIYSAGICASEECFMQFLKLNIKNFDLLHLNDQKHQFGTGNDQHCSLLQGAMFGQFDIQKVGQILYDCITRFDNIIIEFTDTDSNTTLNAVKQLHSDTLTLSKSQLGDLQNTLRILSLRYVTQDIQSLDSNMGSLDKNLFKFRAYDSMVSFINEWMNINVQQDVFQVAFNRKLYGLSDKFTIFSFLQQLPDINKHKDLQLIGEKILIKQYLDQGLRIEQAVKMNKQMPQLKRFDRNYIQKICDKFLSLIQKKQDIQYEICGSYRRGAQQNIGDIDILIRQEHQDYLHKLLLESNEIQIISWGKVSKIQFQNNIDIDIVFASQQEWPFSLLYFTGNRYFVVSLRSRAKKNGYKLSSFSLQQLDQQKQIQCESEEHIFKLLGLKFIETQHRITDKLNQWNL